MEALLSRIYELARYDSLFLALIEIAPEWQGRGVGTALVQDLVVEAHACTLPMRLQVLKVNPARSLYERLGFRIVAETQTHYVMHLP